MVLIISCDKVVTEATRIIEISHKIQDKIDFNGREEIFNLLILVKASKPHFTAAGFFKLNRSTLFSILSVTTTYFIILLQFHQDKYTYVKGKMNNNETMV